MISQNVTALWCTPLLFLLIPFAQMGSAQERNELAPEALDKLRIASRQAHSDTVLILKDGKTVVEWIEGKARPIELMSVLKSIVGLGIGRLIELEKIESLDQPVYEFYPEWKQGRKKKITIRHLLNHTSGLQDIPNAGAEIYPSPNAVKLALAAELTEDPGKTFRYNNKATNLLAGIIQQAYGQPMDKFFVNEFFHPMKIEEYKFYFDPSGTPHAMAGLELHARDLAKFGQLVLNDGKWNDQTLVNKDYLTEMLAQSQPHYVPYGLLWWRLPSATRYVFDEQQIKMLKEAGISSKEIDRLRPLIGKEIKSRRERTAALKEIFGDDWQQLVMKRFPVQSFDPIFRREYDDIIAYYGDGYLGQTLMIIPEHRVVAVRQIRGSKQYDAKTDGFDNFKQLVIDLFKSNDPTEQLLESIR